MNVSNIGVFYFINYLIYNSNKLTNDWIVHLPQTLFQRRDRLLHLRPIHLEGNPLVPHFGTAASSLWTTLQHQSDQQLTQCSQTAWAHHHLDVPVKRSDQRRLASIILDQQPLLHLGQSRANHVDHGLLQIDAQVREFHDQFRVVKLLQCEPTIGVRNEPDGRFEFIWVGKAKLVAELGGRKAVAFRRLDEMIDGMV